MKFLVVGMFGRLSKTGSFVAVWLATLWTDSVVMGVSRKCDIVGSFFDFGLAVMEGLMRGLDRRS